VRVGVFTALLAQSSLEDALKKFKALHIDTVSTDQISVYSSWRHSTHHQHIPRRSPNRGVLGIPGVPSIAIDNSGLWCSPSRRLLLSC
jgi:hypothetical protein